MNKINYLKTGYIKYLIMVMVLGIFSLSLSNKSILSSIKVVDKNATKETKALFLNLKKMAKDHVLFGHQDDLAYGVGWKDWHKKRSDVKDVCGQYPAVFGWDMSKLGKSPKNIDNVDFEQMKNWMKEAYKMGSVNTFSWHLDHLTNDKTSWDVGENVVASIIPGGEHHDVYKAKLDVLAAFIDELEVGFVFKKKIPVIFRPFHEHTGGWFWWGADHCSPEEYKELWRFTVTYLRDVKGLNNILYAYSPDIINDADHYMEYYPGDEWVDVLGLDDYHDVGPDGNIEDLTRRLRIVVELAESRGKIAALTETGFESIPDEKWWTDKLLNAIESDEVARRISWLLVWRNDRTTHHYAPYPGHSSESNFKEFCANPFTVFQEDLPNVYKLN